MCVCIQDPKAIFAEIDLPEESSVLPFEQKKRSNRSGYGEHEGKIVLHRTATAAEFVLSDKPVNLLSSCNAFTFDDPTSAL